MQKNFTQLLLEWNETGNTRQMPWKGEKDPYRIWLSEVMLQQTRVEQGLGYYQRFTAAFPTITDLALAKDEAVFKLWEGLGYYSRCRNLLATARFIAFEREGVFPDAYEEILKLKGVGAYTAAAIASFAFGHPFAVLDGNVFRVLSRYFGINTPIDTPQGKKLYSLLANSLLDFNRPADFNQAIMDFGAVVCKPRQPLCSTCVMNGDCQAFQGGYAEGLPVKSKQIGKKSRFFYYFIVSAGQQFLVRKRTGADIWKDLHEWVLFESDHELPATHKAMQKTFNAILPGFKGELLSVSDILKQQLTHQTIRGRFMRVKLARKLPPPPGYQWVSQSTLRELAFPKFITSYLGQQGL